MNDSRAAMAAALAGGYLLGRTKKAKLAFAVGSYVVKRRFGLTPAQLLSEGLGRLQQAPRFRELSDQVRGELLTAGRTAVSAAAERRLTGLADALRDRTDALTGADRRHGEEYAEDKYPEDEYPDEDATGEEYADEEATGEEYADDGPPRPGPAKKAAARKAPAKKVPAGQALAKKAARKAPARRPAPPHHRGDGPR
ncbi:hypothetical protein GCM10010129_05710 [Streptomyces fumigatiscleroticus]|nr:hypothetical protein GCM10010129_05710 [Streptomyces fumigatiscleroticus]